MDCNGLPTACHFSSLVLTTYDFQSDCYRGEAIAGEPMPVSGHIIDMAAHMFSSLIQTSP